MGRILVSDWLLENQLTLEPSDAVRLQFKDLFVNISKTLLITLCLYTKSNQEKYKAFYGLPFVDV